MWQNYLKISFRNLWNSKLYTLINVVGLGIGIAAIVWAYQNYRFSMGFDDFHPQREQIYRGLVQRDGSDGWKGLFPLPLTELAKEEFSSIEETVRFFSQGLDVKPDNSEPFAEHLHFTDPAFFDFFNFPLLSGSNDLTDRSAILITEEMATKYFGQEDPLGKTLQLYAGTDFQRALQVKGVLKNTPMNSTIRFNMLTHIENYLQPTGQQLAPNDWSELLNAAFFKLNDQADVNQLAANFKKYIPIQNAALEDWKVTRFKLITMAENAVDRTISNNSLFERPADSATYGPIINALLILLCACLNFANTTVSRSGRRLKEMGVRKVLGGTTNQLRAQILLECNAIVILAISLSILINAWWLPTYQEMFIYVEAKADYLHDPQLLIFLAITLIGTTLLAGGYPAFYSSRFNPSQIFRGSVKLGGSNLFSRILLGLQVAISVITLIAGIAFSQNSEFHVNYDYGYDREYLITVPTRDESTFYAFRDVIQQVPEVASFAGTNDIIGFTYHSRSAEAEGKKFEVNYFETGEGFLDIMGLDLAAGRGFNASLPTDFEKGMLITQKMASLYGWSDEEALDKNILVGNHTYTIVGILEDFHSHHLFEPLEPSALTFVRPAAYNHIILRAKPGELANAYGQVKAAWTKSFPMKPFGGFYQNEVAAEAINVTTNIAKVFSWFAIVAILLTATGLFALVSLTILKRMKEIGVRRVVGASPLHIIYLVNKGYFWIVIAGILVGCYAGYQLTTLLMDLIYTVNVGVNWPTILFSTIVILIITTLTVGFKVWQTLNVNPAELLKKE